MTGSRSLRRCAACLTDKHLLVIAGITGLVISVSITLAGDSLLGYVSRTLVAQEAGSCSTQPNWPDCATFSCTNGNWSCTGMKSSTGGGGSWSASGCTGSNCGGSTGSMPAGGMTMTKDQCLATCGPMTGTAKTNCETGCNNMGSYTGTSGTSTTTGTSGGTSGTTYSAGTWVDSSGKSAKDICRETMVNITDPSMKERMEYTCRCNTPPIDASCSVSSASASPAGGSTSGCFYSNATKNGQPIGYSMHCTSQGTDCRQGTASGPSVDMAGVNLGTANCYGPGGGVGGSTPSGYGSSGARMRCEATRNNVPTGTIFYCTDRNVGCSRKADGQEAVTSSEVGAAGDNMNCDGWSSGGIAGSYPAAGGASGDRNCYGGAKGVRYANARYKENGVETSGPIYCAGFDAPPCTKGSASGGPQVEILSYAGAPTSCDTPMSGNYGGTATNGMAPYNCRDGNNNPASVPAGEAYTVVNGRASFSKVTCDLSPPGGNQGGMGNYGGSNSYWSQELQKNVPVTSKADCDTALKGLKNSTQEINWCYMLFGSSGGGGGCANSPGGCGGGSQWSTGGGTDPAKNCVMGCESMPSQQKTSPSCTKPNPEPWCTQTVEACKAQCSNVTYPGGGRFDGGTGGQWNDITGPRMSALQELKRQADEMASRAQENGVNVNTEGNAYLQSGQACINAALTPQAINECSNQSNQKSQSIWNKIQSASSNRQFKEIESRVQQMTQFAKKMQAGGTNVQQLDTILSDIMSAISTVKSAMTSGTATPEMTRTDKIYALESQFWQIAQGFQNNQQYGNNEGNGDYADQCEMIRRKMQYVGDNYAAASQLQDMYGKCTRQMQGAVTGKGFDEQKFTDVQDQFEEYGRQDYAKNACAMVDSVMNEASNAINNEAPMMIKKLGKKAGAAAELEALLAKAKGMLNRAYGHRQNNDCDKALMAMQDMERLGEEADRIMSKAGVRMGGQDLAFVDYEQQYNNVTDRVAEKLGKTSTIDMKEFKRHMEKSGYKGAELAAIETLASNPDVLANLFAFASNSQIVKAAANADISSVKLEAIIAENSALLQKVADLELENKNLKTGVKAIVNQIKDETFNPKIAPKIASLLEVASTLPEKEFKAKYEQYVKESNDENYKTGIDPFTDVHTFDKNHEWFISAVKNGVDSGLFKGKADGVFAPTDSANVADVTTVFARALGVDEGSTPESAYAKKMPAYAQEPASGLEDLGVDLSDVFTGSTPGDGATRLQVARLIAAAYGDDLDEAEQSSIVECTDLSKLSTDDQDVIALVATNGIMTCVDGKFNAKGTFNRAQFATVMDRLDGLSDDGTALTDDEEEDEDEDGTAMLKNTHGAAADTGELPKSEPIPEPEPAPAREPDFNSEKLNEQQLKIITALTASFVAQNGKLGVTKEQALRVSKMTSVAKNLANTQKEKFDRWRKQENMPESWIQNQTINLKNMMTDEDLKMLIQDIVPAAGYVMQ